MPKTIQGAAPPDMPAFRGEGVCWVMLRRFLVGLPTLVRNAEGCGNVRFTAIFLVDGAIQFLKRSVPCSKIVKSLQG